MYNYFISYHVIKLEKKERQKERMKERQKERMNERKKDMSLEIGRERMRTMELKKRN